MEYLHFKVMSCAVESVLSRVVKSDMVNVPPHNWVSCVWVKWFWAPESLEAFGGWLVLESDLVNKVFGSSNIDQGWSEISNEVEEVQIPVKNLHSCDIEVVDISGRLWLGGEITTCEVPISSVLIIIPSSVRIHLLGMFKH